ncbi:MAG: hypothetical protein ACK56C_06320 [Alphaproteobacteria bacterium]
MTGWDLLVDRNDLTRTTLVAALQALYADVVAGRMQPDEGHIVKPG